jgi:hypothetical protein
MSSGYRDGPRNSEFLSTLISQCFRNSVSMTECDWLASNPLSTSRSIRRADGADPDLMAESKNKLSSAFARSIFDGLRDAIRRSRLSAEYARWRSAREFLRVRFIAMSSAYIEKTRLAERINAKNLSAKSLSITPPSKTYSPHYFFDSSGGSSFQQRIGTCRL